MRSSRPLRGPAFAIGAVAWFALGLGLPAVARASSVPADAGWRFHFGDPDGAASPSFDDRTWEEVRLPHTWNDTDTYDGTIGYRRGPGWYRKRIAPAALDPGSRVLLELDGGTSRIDVHLNGRHLATRVEGWAGFVQDLTDAWRSDGENVLALRADNSPDHDLAPGKTEPDYIVWGGLFRRARLIRIPAVHLVPRGVSIRPEWRPGPGGAVEAGEIAFLAEARNDSNAVATGAWIEVSVTDPGNGAIVARARSAARSLEPSETTLLVATFAAGSGLRLWSPEEPALYEARVELNGPSAGGPSAVDSATVPFGIRKTEFDPERGFFLNGKPLKLRGFNRHEDYPGVGAALPASLAVKDAEWIRRAGGNFVRTSHYPQSPDFLDACDKLGILVLEEVATWKFTGGWRWRGTIERMMHEMIRRDRAHPSIILWGMMNEGRSQPLFRAARAAARAEDPTRPTIYAEHKFEKALRQGTVFLTDVLGLNYNVESYPDFHAKVPELPLVATEYTNASRTRRGDPIAESKQTAMIVRDLKRIEQWPFLSGGALWCMHDYATERKRKPDITIRPSGVLDAWRIPKEAFFAMRAVWSADPAVRIESFPRAWKEEEAPRFVTSYTGCALSRVLQGRASTGCFLSHVLQKQPSPADESGTSMPAALSWKIDYGSGSIQVSCGERDESALAAPAPAAGVTVAADPRVLASGSGEVSEIEVRVVDGLAHLSPAFQGSARFEIEGPGRLRAIAGGSETPIAMGIGKVLVQENGSPGTVTIRARVADLPVAEATIQVRALTGGPG